MNIWDLIIGILVVLLLALAFSLARDRKKGGGCCSGGGSCSGCSGCSAARKSCCEKKKGGD